MKMKAKTVVFGLGAMGSALVKGWVSSKKLSPSLITAMDVDTIKLKKTAAQLKIKVATDPMKALKGVGLILLAVKPQQMKELLAQAGSQIPAKALVVSIAVGVSTEQIEQALP